MSLYFAIVMPAYNEEGCIEKVVDTWTSFLKHFFPQKECLLIVINDGSRDNTKEILDKLTSNYGNLLVVHQPNGGHGNAVLNGYRKAIELNAEWVFQTDSDDQFVANDVIKLFEKTKYSNFILGYRKLRYDALPRLIITRILKYSIFLLYGVFVNDSNIPFRLIKGSYLKWLVNKLPTAEPFAPNIFLSIIAKKDGQKTFDIPITHIERQTGTVSILRFKLLKVCLKSFEDLWAFRKQLKLN
ncbi:glycosyltransferase family 2 protein [Runella zeae]|uniref:glycosyltransferase family 2 protein n=1 Tax=Runella zeae TaxID=94255 RepID=UPI002353CECB|nr:glycosyltransferase family 2 protein [Runella zeae]